MLAPGSLLLSLQYYSLSNILGIQHTQYVHQTPSNTLASVPWIPILMFLYPWLFCIPLFRSHPPAKSNPPPIPFLHLCYWLCWRNTLWSHCKPITVNLKWDRKAAGNCTTHSCLVTLPLFHMISQHLLCQCSKTSSCPITPPVSICRHMFCFWPVERKFLPQRLTCSILKASPPTCAPDLIHLCLLKDIPPSTSSCSTRPFLSSYKHADVFPVKKAFYCLHFPPQPALPLLLFSLTSFD